MSDDSDPTSPTHSDNTPRLSYEDAVKRGTKLLQEINKLPKDTSSSKFKDFDDLKASGWVSTASPIPQGMLIGLDALVKDRGINMTSAKNKHINWEQTFPADSLADEVATDIGRAEYTQSYNLGASAIFVSHIASPAVKHAENSEYLVPKLNAWSDVTYLQWEKLADTPGDLEMVVQVSISSKQTQGIIQTVLKGAKGNGKTKLAYKDRKTFTEKDGDSFKALLGTPNALGSAWMLAQHKSAKQLGWKCVKSITLFSVVPDADHRTDQMIIELGSHPKAAEVKG